jgi:methionine synthase II (cobalamin-independent)
VHSLKSFETHDSLTTFLNGSFEPFFAKEPIMPARFQANTLPLLIGSLPLQDHGEALELVFDHTPEIPLWVQLPAFPQERMIPQFMPGLPGLTLENDKVFINTGAENFDDQLLEFYEEYMAVADGQKDLEHTRFVLTAETAKGFTEFMERSKSLSSPPVAVKGQITGPITFSTGVHDQNKNAIFYNEQIRDAAVKLIALKAKWQARQLASLGCPVIIFFDEPALAGYGTSEFISISHAEITLCFAEVMEAVQSEGALAGVHVCANTDWSLVLESPAEIVSFDAYSYFDRFILYPDLIKKFIESGKILAWGIVPTGNAEDIEKETTDSLVALWDEKARAIEALGIDRSRILAQSLITPSCGAGSLSLDLAKKVLKITREVSEQVKRL